MTSEGWLKERVSIGRAGVRASMSFTARGGEEDRSGECGLAAGPGWVWAANVPCPSCSVSVQDDDLGTRGMEAEEVKEEERTLPSLDGDLARGP